MFPGKYGVPKPFYFPFLPSYWLGRPLRKRSASPSAPEVSIDNIKLSVVGFKLVLLSIYTYSYTVICTCVYNVINIILYIILFVHCVPMYMHAYCTHTSVAVECVNFGGGGMQYTILLLHDTAHA